MKNYTDIKIQVSYWSTVNESNFPEGFKNNLIEAIDLRKADRIWKDRKDTEHDFHKGTRFNNSDRVAKFIMCNMDYATLIGGADLLGYIQEMDMETKQEWIDSALSHSASCDHWYTYEKQW